MIDITKLVAVAQQVEATETQIVAIVGSLQQELKNALSTLQTVQAQLASLDPTAMASAQQQIDSAVGTLTNANAAVEAIVTAQPATT